MVVCCMVFFFFKQMPAYEVRSSDWSSDVCSSDLLLLLAALEAFDPALDWSQAAFRNVEDQDWERAWMDQYAPLRFGARAWIVPWNHELPAEADAPDAAVVRLDPGLAFGSGTHPTTSLCRSEEHTSELQSLMRNSYA